MDPLSTRLTALGISFGSFFTFLTLTVFQASGEDNRERVQRQNIAPWVLQLFSAKKLDTQYEFSFALNPFYLRGDFNGGSKPDVAILVRTKWSQKLGIAVCHGDQNEAFVVGAGTTTGNGGDDFGWMDVWSVYRMRPSAPLSLDFD